MFKVSNKDTRATPMATYFHFRNLYYTLQCKVKLLIIAAFGHLAFTIEHIFAAFIRFKFTIIFITQIISTLLSN